MFLRRTAQQFSAHGSRGIVIAPAEGSYRPQRKDLVVRFVDVGSVPKNVRVDGKELPRAGGPAAGWGWSYDPQKRVLTVRCGDATGGMKIEAGS